MNYFIAQTFSLVDLIVLIILILSSFIGYNNGFIKEILSLTIWVFSILTALLIFNKSINFFLIYYKKSILLDIISFLVPFCIFFILYSLFSKLIFNNVSELKNLVFNRFFGFLFGMLRGFSLIVISFAGLFYLFNTKENLPVIFNESFFFEPMKNFSIYILEFSLSIV